MSNLLWAYASMHNSRETNKELMKKLEYWCECIMDDFAAQGVSNSLWAFATLGHTLRPEVVSLFSKAIKKNMKDFKSMEFSNVVWAIATMKLELDPRTLRRHFMAVSRQHQRVSQYVEFAEREQHFVGHGDAPAKVRPQHDEFLKTLVQFVERKSNTFICQGLSNTLWASRPSNTCHLIRCSSSSPEAGKTYWAISPSVSPRICSGPTAAYDSTPDRRC